MNGQKRVKRILPLTLKVKILDRLVRGEGSSAVARDYGLNESTVRTMKKNEERIRASAAANFLARSGGINCANIAQTSFYTRDSIIERMEESLNEWIEQQNLAKIPIDGSQIREKARQIYEFFKLQDEMNDSDNSATPKTASTITNARRRQLSHFVASKGWLAKFKSRYGLHTSKLAATITRRTPTSPLTSAHSSLISSNIPQFPMMNLANFIRQQNSSSSSSIAATTTTTTTTTTVDNNDYCEENQNDEQMDNNRVLDLQTSNERLNFLLQATFNETNRLNQEFVNEELKDEEFVHEEAKKGDFHDEHCETQAKTINNNNSDNSDNDNDDNDDDDDDDYNDNLVDSILTPKLTLKKLENGFRLAKKLEVFFLTEDQCTKRSLKFKTDLELALSQYRQLYRYLSRNSKRKNI